MSKIVAFHPHGDDIGDTLGARTLEPLYMMDRLRGLGCEVTNVSWSASGRKTKRYQSMDYVLSRKKPAAGLQTLRDLDPDYVVVCQQSSWEEETNDHTAIDDWFFWIDRLGKPFFVMCHETGEQQLRKWVGQYEQFRGFIVGSPSVYAHVTANHTDPVAAVNELTYYLRIAPRCVIDHEFEKHPLVVSTSRISKNKSINLLASLAGLLKPQVSVESYGPSDTHELAMWQRLFPEWSYKNAFVPTDLDSILGPAMFHWRLCEDDPASMGFSTMEAIAYGCVPIVSSVALPAGFDETSCLAVDPNNHAGAVEAIQALTADVSRRKELVRNAQQALIKSYLDPSAAQGLLQWLDHRASLEAVA